MSKKPSSGFTLVEMLVAIAIMAIAIPQGVSLFIRYNDQQISQLASQQQTKLERASLKYLKANEGTLLSGALPRVINIDELRGGYIPESFFKCGNATCNASNPIGQGVIYNPYSQKYKIVVRKYTAKGKALIDALLITEGGSEVGKGELLATSRLIGVSGGYTSGGMAIGTQKLWSFALSSFGGYANVGDGHFVSWLLVSDGASRSNDFLYRSSVSGKPELNKMNTNLSLGGHTINDAADINAAGNVSAGNVTSSYDVKTTNGWLITQGNQGWRNITHDGGWYMSDNSWIRSWGDKSIYTGGQVQAGAINSNGRLHTGEYLQIDGVAVADQRCSPNGLLGRDASGAILSCQAGVWAAGSGDVGLLKPHTANGRFVAHSNGYLAARSGHNSWLGINVNGNQVCEMAARDKYGQGKVSCSAIIRKGDSYSISGSEATFWRDL